MNSHYLPDRGPAFRVFIQSIPIGNDPLRIPENGMTIIVGSNNSGKSTLLKEISAALTSLGQYSTNPFILNETIFEPKWSSDQTKILSLIKDSSWYHEARNNIPSEVKIPLADTSYSYDEMATQIKSGSAFSLINALVLLSTPETRARDTFCTPQREQVFEHQENYLHVLQDDKEAFNSADSLCFDTFGMHLTLDIVGQHITLRVGRTESPTPTLDNITRDYVSELKKLPSLAEQGDGVKNFLATTLPIICAHSHIVLIDEPEAFLHPPHAFKLGQTLARIAETQRIQIIAATHDKNFLRGALSASTDTTVIRLNRIGNNTKATLLDSNDINSVWNDPVLHYSNAFDAIFHRYAVLLEADPDCRFIAAAMDEAANKHQISCAPEDIIYIPTAGREGMPKIVRALRALNIPTVAAPDLDVLEDKGKLKLLTDSFDIDWTEIEQLHRSATSGLKPPPSNKTCGDVLAMINRRLADKDKEPWTSAHRSEIANVIKTTDQGRTRLSDHGESYFRGTQAAAYRKLMTVLEEHGICCVRAGCLEMLAPEVETQKGPSWLPAALRSSAHRGEPAQQHVKAIARVGGFLRSGSGQGD